MERPKDCRGEEVTSETATDARKGLRCVVFQTDRRIVAVRPACHRADGIRQHVSDWPTLNS